jgi:glycosyltransferase involved in cell wall biosynthesis
VLDSPAKEKDMDLVGIVPAPRVSVGMPVYNGEKFVGEGIQSILNQSFSDLELIVCDNASTDSTGEICRRIAAADRRLRYYANPTNIGVSENYNKAFQHSRGEYFKWASCNDYCAEGLIEGCAEVLDRRPDAILCYPKTRVFDIEIADAEDYEDNLNLQEDDPLTRFEQLIDRLYLRLNNVMNGLIRVDALKKTQLHQGFAGSDYNLLAELILQGKFVEIPERLFYRRINAKSHSRSQSESEMQRRYWPNDKKALMFQTWRLHRGCFAAISRAPFSYRRKFRLFLMVAKRLKLRKRKVAREFLSALR